MHFLIRWLVLFGVCNANTGSNYPTVALPRCGSNPNSSEPGTVFRGRSLPEFQQDLFLGIKYADKPGRFEPSFVKFYSQGEVYDATEYGFDCPGYGTDTDDLVKKGLIQLDEDCLNLNIVRPWTSPNETGEGDWGLPVLLWIYGGGWQQGATADPRYNLSYIIQQSAEIGKPVLGISINYRLAAFGFLDSIEESGNTNLGLRDQRNAMHWVKSYIRAFGGDPERITIWGESAGAYSVGDQLVVYNGDNEGLFRAAIMESGNAVGPPYNGTDWHQPMYDRIVARANCTDSDDTLQCLRSLPYNTFYDIAYEGLEWFVVVDGHFVTQFPQKSYQEGKFAKVPLLLGTNTDEGTSFGTTGEDTSAECVAQLISSKRWVLDRNQASELLKYYPDIPALGCPYGWGNTTWPALGAMYKRYESMAGDITMVGPRRLLAETMARYSERVYSYRWDVPALNNTDTIGVQHFAEIPFVFCNPVQDITPLGTNPTRLQLGQLAARMWTSFAADLEPNGHGVPNIPKWETYTHGQEARNIVFRLPRYESYIEADAYRWEGIAFINSIQR